jgi:hypothetical protein
VAAPAVFPPRVDGNGLALCENRAVFCISLGPIRALTCFAMLYRPLGRPFLAASGSSDSAAQAAMPGLSAGGPGRLDLARWGRPAAGRDAAPDSHVIVAGQLSLVTRHALRAMSDSTPRHAGFDRAAVTILGSMVTLIAVLSLVLMEASMQSSPEQVPVAASVAGLPSTP